MPGLCIGLSSRSLLLLALTLSVIPATAAAKKTKTLVLERPSSCEHRVQAGSVVWLHYSARVKGETEPFDETYTVGRPKGMTVGAGEVQQELDRVAIGMCLGEKKRVTIPPELVSNAAAPMVKAPPEDATLVYEIEMVKVDGFSIIEGAARTQTREEDMSEGESDMEGAAAAEEESPPRASGASHLEPTACDACHVIVEEFYTAWLELSRKQASQAEMQSGGAEIPAITYNDDTEEMVQSFCGTDRIGSTAYDTFVKSTCESIFKVHKRELVGKFLSAPNEPKYVPERKHQVCHEMVNACPDVSNEEASKNKCSRCRATVQDLLYVRRVQSPTLKLKPRYYWDLLDDICDKTVFRHNKHIKLMETCQDLVDEYDKELVAILKDLSLTAEESEKLFCLETTKSCKAKHFLPPKDSSEL